MSRFARLAFSLLVLGSLTVCGSSLAADNPVLSSPFIGSVAVAKPVSGPAVIGGVAVAQLAPGSAVIRTVVTSLEVEMQAAFIDGAGKTIAAPKGGCVEDRYPGVHLVADRTVGSLGACRRPSRLLRATGGEARTIRRALATGF